MQLQRFETAEGLLAVADEFLVAREAAHNLLLGIINTLMTAPAVYRERPYLAVITDRDRVLGGALQTPPWELALSEMDSLAAVDLVVGDRLGDQLPGVIGPVEATARFAAGWERATGTPTRVAMRERVFSLEAVIHPRRAPGRMRPVGPADRALLRQWLGDFTEEALDGHLPADLDHVVDRWIAGLNRTMYLWVDNGLPVSLAGLGSPTPHGVRIGPVFTPTDLRGRGYASNLVAAVSAAALDSGHRSCFLFTDLANATSNHIYESIGYEPVSDVDRWAFGSS